MNKKITVSVGIPAHNEQENIAQLIKAIIHQKIPNYRLKEIIVVADGCRDNTVSEVKNIKDKRVKLIINRKRIGQALSQNKILKAFESDYLLLLNADVLIFDFLFTSKLLTPFLKNKSLGISSPQILPLPASTLFGKVINHSVFMKRKIFMFWKKGNNLYSCHGRARMFSREYAKKLKWPAVIGEDAFSYLAAASKGFNFEFNKSTAVFYQSPQTFSDHARQSIRFLQNEKELSPYFPKTIKSEMNIPLPLILRTSLSFFLKNPFYFFLYFAIIFAVKYAYPKKTHRRWDSSVSSKLLPSVSQQLVLIAAGISSTI